MGREIGSQFRVLRGERLGGRTPRSAVPPAAAQASVNAWATAVLKGAI